MTRITDTAGTVPIEGWFGLERENLRVQTDGRLAATPHPQAFGDKLTNPLITTDFSESQIELITPVAADIPSLVASLSRQLCTVYRGLGSELLWPLSNLPDGVPDEHRIPIADFGPNGIDKTNYRHYLARKYGARRQLYCGIHFNFSFRTEQLSKRLPEQAARNAFYLQMAATAMRARFFLVYLLAGSPGVEDGTPFRSLRLGKQGYRNLVPVYPDYSSVHTYSESLRSAIEGGVIEGPRELYQLVRLKGSGFSELDGEPIAERIELRIPDLNPFEPLGIAVADLWLMHLYLLWAASARPQPFDRQAQQEAAQLADEAALMQPSFEVERAMKDQFEQLERFVAEAALPEPYTLALSAAKTRWINDAHLGYASRVAAALADRPRAAHSWAKQMKTHFTANAVF
ncbi:MAG: glutathione synthase [Sporolactobacillus sp.]